MPSATCGKALPFTVNLAFRKAHVPKSEIIDAVRQLLKRLESESRPAAPTDRLRARA